MNSKSRPGRSGFAVWKLGAALVLLLLGLGLAMLVPLPTDNLLSLQATIDAWHPGDDHASGTVSNPSDKSCWLAGIWLDYGYKDPADSVAAGPHARPSLAPHASARWNGRLYPPIPSGTTGFEVHAGCIKPLVRTFGPTSQRAGFDAVAIGETDTDYVSQGNLIFEPMAWSDFVIAGPGFHLSSPKGLSFFGGRYFVADTGNNRVLVAALPTSANRFQSEMSTLAGNGVAGYSGDGQPPVDAALDHPSAVAVDPEDGSIYIADTGNNRIRAVDGRGTVIRTVAGTGEPGHSGDGGPATAATITAPRWIAVIAGSRLALADGNAVRIVNLRSGTIESLKATFNNVTGLASCGAGAVLNVIDSARDRLSIVTFGEKDPTVIGDAAVVHDAGGIAVTADCTHVLALDLTTGRVLEIFLTGW
jgi:hypothetical protein